MVSVPACPDANPEAVVAEAEDAPWEVVRPPICLSVEKISTEYMYGVRA